MSSRPPVDYIQRTRDQYDHLGYPPYRWVHSDTPAALAPLTRPLRELRLGLIASGGIYRHGQIAFHYRDDLSYREIATDTPVADLRATHFAYDLTDARSDPNVVFPLQTLRRCVQQGWLGGLAQRAFSFMGGIYSSRQVRDVLAPALAERVCAEDVDALLLVPV